MLPCRCAGVLIVAFGCVCGSVNNGTALGKTVLHSFLSACWLVIPFIVGLSLGVSVCRCECVCVSVCVSTCGSYVRGLGLLMVLLLPLDVNN